MVNKEIKVVRLHADARVPRRAHWSDSGADLSSVEDRVVQPGETAVIRTGIAIEIPDSFEGQVRPRSSLSAAGLQVQLGTIDSSYRGEIGVIVYNANQIEWAVSAGARIAQLVIAPVSLRRFRDAESLSASARGTGGFGSTGE